MKTGCGGGACPGGEPACNGKRGVEPGNSNDVEEPGGAELGLLGKVPMRLPCKVGITGQE